MNDFNNIINHLEGMTSTMGYGFWSELAYKITVTRILDARQQIFFMLLSEEV